MSRACLAPLRGNRRLDAAPPSVSAGRLCGGLGLLVGVVALVACSGKGAAGPSSERGVRDTTLRTEKCAHKNGFDTNRDGKKDLFEVVENGRTLCRAADLDFDGVIDQVSFFDANGVVRRREIDFDGNGVPNIIEHYRAGTLVLREIDGANLGRIDMWDAFDPTSGVRTTRERDTNGDGRIDQYWSFSGAQITVRFDRNEDGVPDEEGVLVWGEGFESAQPAADAGASESDAGVEPASPDGTSTDAGATDGGAK